MSSLVSLTLLITIVLQKYVIFGESRRKPWTDWIESKSFLDWYSPGDICTLYKWNNGLFQLEKRGNTTSSIQQKEVDNKIMNIVKKCKSFNDNDKRYRDKANFLNENTCKAPFDIISRPYFTKNIRKYNNMNESNGLIEMVLFFIKNKKTIIFLGDSLSEHSYSNFRMELIRLSTSFKSPPLLIGNEFEKDKVDLVNKNKVFNIIKSITDLQYRGFDVAINGDNNNSNNNSTFYFYRFNRYENEKHFETYFKKLLLTTDKFYNGSIIIANIGVWVNYRHDGLIFFEKILRYLNDYNNNNIIFWRETTAQHFSERENGYYDNEINYKNESEIGYCIKHQKRNNSNNNFNSKKNYKYNSNNSIDWRNEDVKSIIKRFNLKNINYIHGIYNMTKPLYNMHTVQSAAVGRIDCTHYCWWPMFWQILWQQITKVVNNKYNIRQIK